MTKRILILNGRLVDPAEGVDRQSNLLIEDGVVAAIDVDPQSVTPDGLQTIAADDCIVSPGWIDVGAQLREPGFEEDETIASGCRAAIAGGYTTIACTANTEPPIDTPPTVEFIRQKAARADLCKVVVLACLSKSRSGEELSEMGALVEAGAVGFTDAPRPIANSALLYRALQYCQMFNTPILSRPEVVELSHQGVMHEGLTSLVLGLAGMPAEAEDVMTSRDLRLAESSGGRLHLMSVSTEGSVSLIRRHKGRGLAITADTTPAQFSLTEENLRTFDARYKVNPPLRSHKHLQACLTGLADGTIDIIASGHAPRAREKKMQELDQAPFGAIGLETTLSLCIEKLIDTQHLTWTQLIEKVSLNPARLLGVAKGTLAVGSEADVAIIDPNIQWRVSADELASDSCNTPWLDHQLTGRARWVIVGGEIKLAPE